MLLPAIKAKLDELKISYKSGTAKDDLYALLPADTRAQIEAQEKADADAEQVAKDKADAENATPALDVANVFSDNDAFVRAYSFAIHGTGFEDLAKEFIANRGGFTYKLAAVAIDPEPAKPAPIPTADVFNRGELLRSFSLDIHGEDFEKIAHQFADRQGFEVKLR